MRDDVPAYLSGGEFVINKNAVKRIGKNNLDLLNNTPHFASGGVYDQPAAYTQLNNNTFAGNLTDSDNISNNSADVSLANAYLLGVGNTGTGRMDKSALTDINAGMRIFIASGIEKD